MKKTANKAISIAASLCLLLSAVMITGIPRVKAAAPEGYSTAAEAPNEQLLDGQYFKLVTGFENNTGIANTTNNQQPNDVRIYETTHFLSGSASCSLSFFNGEAGGHSSLSIKMDATNNNWSDAKYLQFYVENSDTNNLELFFFKINGKAIKDAAKGIMYYDMTNKYWSELTVSASAKYGVPAIKVPGKAKGIVRIPLTTDVFEDGLSFATVNNFEFYAHIPGHQAGAKAYFDDIGVVAGADNQFKSAYTATPSKDVALQQGQTYLKLTDFSNNRSVAAAGCTTNAITYGAANTVPEGEKYNLVFNAGGANDICYPKFAPENPYDTDWSAAKYLQIGVNNPTATTLRLAKIEYFVNGAAGRKIKATATAELYNSSTKKWSIINANINANLNPYVGFDIPANTTGYLRIKLNADNFESYNAAEMVNVNMIEIFIQMPGCAANSAVSLDDIGLIAGPDTNTKGFEFETNPNKDVNLQDGQTYKELNSFEADAGVQFGVVGGLENSIKGSYSATNAQNGSKSYSISFSDGGQNSIAYPSFKPEDSSNTDWTGANSFQFFINNTASSKLQINDIKYTAGQTNRKLKKTAKVLFFNTEKKIWSILPVADGANPAYYGIEIPASTKGFVRIALNADNFDGYSAAEMSNVVSTQLFLQMPGCPLNSVIYFDDFGLIGGNETTLPADSGYTESSSVKLNPGELYKPITGFEDSDKVSVSTIPNTVDFATDVKNNGEKSLYVNYTNGDASGHQNFVFDTSSNTTSNWSKAKYLQFYVKNTCPADCAPLQLFYIQVNTGNKILNHGAKGIKLYNKKTGKWSGIDVVDNSDHIISQNPLVYVPTIQIPAGFEGYVRIPLTNENFTNCTLSNELPSITRFQIYSLIKGIPGPQKVYYDDFGLVTYEGDTAPAYVDDKVDDPTDPTDPTDPNEVNLKDGKDDQYLSIEKTFDLSGIIKDASGKPLAGAEMVLDSNMTTKTNSKGEYLFKGVKTGLHELTVKGADGTDYGYLTFEVLTGAGTRYKGTDIRIGHDATGITINIAIDDLGLKLSGVTDGSFTPAVDGSSNDSKKDDIKNSGTGDSILLLALSLMLLSMAGLAIAAKRRKA